MTMPLWTPTKKQLVLKLFTLGLCTQDIANKLEIPRAVVSTKIKRHPDKGVSTKLKT